MRRVLTTLMLVVAMALSAAPSCLASPATCHMKHAQQRDCCKHAAIQALECCCNHSTAPAVPVLAAADHVAGQNASLIVALPSFLWAPSSPARPDRVARANVLRPPDTPVQLRTTLLL